MFNQIFTLTRAIHFAAQKHKKQRRKGGHDIPYINHPIEVMNRVAEGLETPSYNVLAAAVLHDVLEDTKTTPEEIRENFGQKILDLVEELSDNMNLPSKERKRIQAKTAKNLSDEAKCIRIADKICNIKDILSTPLLWTRKRKLEYINWSEQVVNACRGVSPKLEEAFDEIARSGREKLS